MDLYQFTKTIFRQIIFKRNICQITDSTIFVRTSIKPESKDLKETYLQSSTKNAQELCNIRKCAKKIKKNI